MGGDSSEMPSNREARGEHREKVANKTAERTLLLPVFPGVSMAVCVFVAGRKDVGCC